MGRLVLEDLGFHQMLVVEDGKVQRLQLSHDPRSASFFVADGAVGEQNWKIHASGRIVHDGLETSLAPRNLDQLMARFESFSVKPEVLYEKLRNRGLEYGPCFQTIEHLMTAGEEILARLSVYDPKRYTEDHYLVHPTLLDGAFQALIAALGQRRSGWFRSRGGSLVGNKGRRRAGFIKPPGKNHSRSRRDSG